MALSIYHSDLPASLTSPEGIFIYGLCIAAQEARALSLLMRPLRAPMHPGSRFDSVNGRFPLPGVQKV